jgi:hypothetical protein
MWDQNEAGLDQNHVELQTGTSKMLTWISYNDYGSASYIAQQCSNEHGKRPKHELSIPFPKDPYTQQNQNCKEIFRGQHADWRRPQTIADSNG